MAATRAPETPPSIPHKFTATEGYARTPAFSPSGDRLAFSVDESDRSHIFVQKFDGSAANQVTNGDVRDYEPAWSPDGSRIAFVRRFGTAYQVRVLGLTTGEEKVLTEIAGSDHIDWSPDGKWLATSDQESPPASRSIQILSAENGARRRVTAPPPGILGDRSARFSPDGRSIAFVRTAEGGNEDIY